MRTAALALALTFALASGCDDRRPAPPPDDDDCIECDGDGDGVVWPSRLFGACQVPRGVCEPPCVEWAAEQCRGLDCVNTGWGEYCTARCSYDDDCEGGSGCRDLAGRGVLHCAR